MRAVIADDSVLLREGIARLLAEDDIEVVAGVGDAGSLLDAVRALEVVRQIFARSRRADPLAKLTARKREALALMAEGRSNSVIAQALFLSAGALGKRVASIFAKLGLPADDEQTHRRVMAVVRYLNS